VQTIKKQPCHGALMGFEQRKSRRVKVTVHGELWLKDDGLKRLISFKTLNISDTGMALQTWTKLDKGTAVECRLVTLDKPQGFRFPAKVVHCQPAEEQPVLEARRRQEINRQLNDIRIQYTDISEEALNYIYDVMEGVVGKGAFQRGKPKPAAAPEPKEAAPAQSAKPSAAKDASVFGQLGIAKLRPLKTENKIELDFGLVNQEQAKKILDNQPHLVMARLQKVAQFQNTAAALENNIPAQGLSIETEGVLPLEHGVYVEYHLPGFPLTLHSMAMVKNCMPLPGYSDRFVSSLQFLSIERSDAEQMEILLTEYS
jgi:hypothetical protein